MEEQALLGDAAQSQKRHCDHSRQGPIVGAVSSQSPDIQEQLSELVERCKEVADAVGEGQEVFAECSYCHGAVPLWEALFTQQIAGLFAHLTCPKEQLQQVVGGAAPMPEFDYDGLVEAVEARMSRSSPSAQAGCIEVASPEGVSSARTDK